MKVAGGYYIRFHDFTNSPTLQLHVCPSKVPLWFANFGDQAKLFGEFKAFTRLFGSYLALAIPLEIVYRNAT